MAKGVQKANEHDLAHEMEVFSRLSRVQGENVPVCLGKITLESPYPLVTLARVTQMLLMSWSGTALCMEPSIKEKIDIRKKTQEVMDAMASCGVRHLDISEGNLLWNAERQQLMVIDCGMATIVPTRKRKRSS